MIHMLKTLDVVAAIIERNGQILLAQRPPHADQPGMWELAGGKVEPGETQAQALIPVEKDFDRLDGQTDPDAESAA